MTVRYKQESKEPRCPKIPMWLTGLRGARTGPSPAAMRRRGKFHGWVSSTGWREVEETVKMEANPRIVRGYFWSWEPFFSGNK